MLNKQPTTHELRQLLNNELTITDIRPQWSRQLWYANRIRHWMLQINCHPQKIRSIIICHSSY